MIEVFKYQILDADGNLREMPDMITLGRIAELNAIIVLGSELKVPQALVSPVGHYTSAIDLSTMTGQISP